MPDITMCTGANCPLRKSCYRYMAKPSQRQSYFDSRFITKAPSWGGDKYYCDSFIEIDCSHCQGIGSIQQTSPGGGHTDPETCEDCNGTGFLPKETETAKPNRGFEFL
ncbi:hypothetical protein LCGC14_0547420 [marine sediment metagenome]|uniref:Uncharacterized protein n=1 Tax=marine sediment metagenome TaxID=412755 RepID=A0A0F9RVS8_9ZZZZ